MKLLHMHLRMTVTKRIVWNFKCFAKRPCCFFIFLISHISSTEKRHWTAVKSLPKTLMKPIAVCKMFQGSSRTQNNLKYHTIKVFISLPSRTTIDIRKDMKSHCTTNKRLKYNLINANMTYAKTKLTEDALFYSEKSA